MKRHLPERFGAERLRALRRRLDTVRTARALADVAAAKRAYLRRLRAPRNAGTAIETHP